MGESLSQILADGGKSNSLGRTNEVIDQVLNDRVLIDELYLCIFSDDAWIRMRAIDALEKVCRVHPSWLEPYIDKFFTDLSNTTQASIQWHLAQIYMQVELTPAQTKVAVIWLKNIISTTDVDWIVAANAMDALMYFYKKDYVSRSELAKLITIQLSHTSKSVVKRANGHLGALKYKY